MESAEVTAALQSSRYNDTVVVNVQQQESSANDNDKDEQQQQQQQEILLVPCLDETNGGIIWNDLAAATTLAEASSLDTGIVRHLRTKRWVFPMLNDQRRNELYETAIRAACYQAVVQQQRSSSCNTNTNTNSTSDSPLLLLQVLDIGSGTGLLSMLAAKYVKQALKENNNDNYNDATANTSVHVTSLEMSAAMSRLARLIVADNDMQDHITVLEQHSTTMAAAATDTEQRGGGAGPYQLCVSELLESSLLGEGMLPAIRDAWERHLAPNAIVVPQHARVYGQLVEGAFLQRYWGPHHDDDSNSNSDQNSETSPRLCLSNDKEPTAVMLDGGSRGGIVLHIHADHWMDINKVSTEHTDRTQTTTNPINNNIHEYQLKPLSEPVPVMDFDFSKPGMLPGPHGRTNLTATIVPHTSGTAHAVLFWWELDLWNNYNCNCTYSMQPGNNKGPWQDHWHQNLFVFTNNNNNNNNASDDDTDGNNNVGGTTNDNNNDDDRQGYKVQAGEECELMASHDDTSLWFPTIRSNSKKNPPPAKRLKADDDYDDHDSDNQNAAAAAPQGLISPMRAWQLNNRERESFLQRGIAAALKCKGRDALVLDVSDFSLCAILAALEGATRVSSLESSTSGVVPNLSARVAQLANGLPRDNCLFQVLQCYAEQLSIEILKGGSDEDAKTNSSPAAAVEVVVAEPYYEMLERWHLQEALNYYYLVQALRRRGIVSDTARCVPSVAVVRGCAIQSLQLRSAYKRCGGGQSENEGAKTSSSSKVCGFDHRLANQYGDRFHTYDLSLPIWEYDYVELTESFEIAKLSYENAFDGPGPIQHVSTTRVPFRREGICHALIMWIEYGADIGIEAGDKTTTSDNTGSVEAVPSSLEFHSTLGRSYRQLVRMGSEPVTIPKDDYFEYELVCHAAFGNQKQLESHTIDFSIQRRSDES